MPSDFLNAHRRHTKDAEILFGLSRWANADHLFGMPVDQSGSPSGHDKKHADAIWDRYEAYRSGHSSGTGYALFAPNPFSTWSVHQRYDNENGFTEAGASQHQIANAEVIALIRKAELEGLI